MKQVEGYIFDYGGTLDTGGCHWGKRIWHAYEKANVPVGEEAYRSAYVFTERTLGKQPIIQPDYTFRKTLEVKLRIQFDFLQEGGHINESNFKAASLQASILNSLYGQVQETVKASRDVLERLAEHYPLVLVSNFYGNISVVLDEFGLNGLFKDVVESAVVGVRKPDPRIFQLGVEKLQMPAASVVVVGDSISKDILPAKKAGCQTVWMKGEGWTDDVPDESIPDRIITNLAELLEPMQ